jgi:hypothetical protein
VSGTGSLRVPRRIALVAIAVLVSAASAASFAESYRGLFLWAVRHGLRGVWAAGFPLQVDVFIAVGELALFVVLADRWAARSRVAAWAVTVAGLVVSVAGNVGHVAGSDLASRATAAVPPLAAAAALVVGLGVLKRVVASRPGLYDAIDLLTYCSPWDAPEPGASVPQPGALANGHSAPEGGREATEIYAAGLSRGELPSIRQVQREMHLGQPRAQQVRSYLELLART